LSYRLTVIGTSYLGAVVAGCMADLGYEVLGVDIDARKVATLSTGKAPVYEPGLDDVLHRGVQSGRLRFTTSYEEVAEFGDVHFLCLGTPQKEGEYAADLSQVNDAVASLAPLLRRECLVVGRSTTPVGTADNVAKELARLAPVGEGAELAWSPEFTREGHAIRDHLSPDRIVVGVRSARAERILREVYAPLIDAGAPLIVTDCATAELVKSAANAFLATKISFINAMAEVCEAVHGDVTKLAEALSYDDRIGGKFLQAGLGFGGGCLPKDNRAFMARAGELGVDQALSFLKEVDDINMRRRARMVDLARELLGGSFSGRRVGVFGAAFKPNSDDVRDSPALDVAATIHRQGAVVTVYDPIALDGAKRAHPELEYADSARGAADGADIVLHLTEWPEFREMDPADLNSVVAERNIVDGRNALDPDRWRESGWHYRALGRP
jgi:UDPglucose 6-dehydrogenase